MRWTLSALICIPLAVAAETRMVPGGNGNPATGVMRYECLHATYAQDGFRCIGQDRGRLLIKTSDWKAVPKETRDLYRYRLDLFLLRFIQLGMRHFSIASKGWRPGHVNCTKTRRDRFDFDYSCGPLTQD